MNKFFILFVVSFLFLAIIECSYASENVRLLIRKSYKENDAVLNKNLTVEYNIFNTGSGIAYNITTTDDSYPAEHFEVVESLTSNPIVKLAPGTNLTQILVLKPLLEGEFTTKRALVHYRLTPGGDPKAIYSSDSGYVYVYGRERGGGMGFFGFILLGICSLLPAAAIYFYSQQNKKSAPGKKEKIIKDKKTSREKNSREKNSRERSREKKH